LIFEYSLILTFVSLCLILLFSAFGIESLKELLLIRSSNEGDLFRKRNARLELWYQVVIILISVLFFIRGVLLLLAPSELSKFLFLPNAIIHLLITSFIFQIFWALLWFFLYQKKEVRLEEKAIYLKKTFFITIIVGITDIVITTSIFFQGFFYLFSIRGGKIIQFSTYLSLIQTPILIISIAVLILFCTLFVLFVLKRSMIILKQYWLVLLILIAITLVYALVSGMSHLGWYENTQLRLSLFSFSYGYIGWIFLIFIAITVFCNVASIILYSIVDKFVNPVKYKNQIISYLKMGFVTALSFAFLALMPNIMLWFYML
jgi:hypothetical protein